MTQARNAAVAQGALAGIRVLDLSRVLSGPVCGQYLADMGAQVIKIEAPDGDTSRQIPPVGAGNATPLYLACNRNKLSAAIDLTTQGGRDVLLDLIATADVLIENFTSRVMRGFGLDFATLSKSFPRLVYCSISGYGREGSKADAPGYDPTIAAEAGLISLNGGGDGRPVVSSLPVVDLLAAMNAAIAVLGALQARERTGLGQFVETSLFDSAIAALNYKGMEYLVTGSDPYIVGHHSPMPPGGDYATSDTGIWVAPTSDRHVDRLLRNALGRPDLADDARFNTLAQRFKHRDALHAEVAAIFATCPASEWETRVRAASVPCGIINSVPQALDDEFVKERGLVRHLSHPVMGDVPVIASAIRMSGTPTAEPLPPPLIGEHSRFILGDLLGYTPDRIENLLEQGAVGAFPTQTN